MNTHSKMSLFIAGLIIALIAPVHPCIALDINVRKNSTAKSETIVLGDIATFNPSKDNRVRELMKIEVSAAPVPNAFRRINRDLLFYRIRPFISDKKDIFLKAPEDIIVNRSAQVVESELIENIYRDYIMDNSPWEPGKISIESVNTPGSIALPEGHLSWEIRERQNRNFVGNVTLLIDFIVDGKSARKIVTSGKISLIRDVVKAAKDIQSGQIISRDDLIVVTENKTHFRNNIISVPDDAIGKRAARRIQANQTIQARMIEKPPMIQKGDRVIIKAENHEVRITVSGEALEEGFSGEAIRVKNINSGRELIATVRRSDLVEVNF